MNAKLFFKIVIRNAKSKDHTLQCHLLHFELETGQKLKHLSLGPGPGISV